MASGGVGKGQRQLHFPVHVHEAFIQPETWPKLVRPDLQPLFLTLFFALVNVKAAERRLFFARFARFGGQLAARIG
ncbi:Uncharacterised protein [Leclercia adecarboxylata]|uniref:Uncharacterized protein n=1 Tax=Leclercia adecarboxylata TaxID=83655 RepID=A0A4U9I0J1_9ENTR|nr:Uncharacterised protein [Leclercia adecarboxylata]